MKNPIANHPNAHNLIKQAAIEYIQGCGYEAGSLEKCISDYVYFAIEIDGWEDIVKTALGSDLYADMQTYWDWSINNTPLASIPDEICINALHEAEIKMFGRVVD